MSKDPDIKLSSKWTNLMFYSVLVITLVLLPIFITQFITKEFHIGFIMAGFICFGLFCLSAYLFMYLSHAHVIGQKIIFKKLFRKPKSYSFDRIGPPSSFQIRLTKYISVEMKNDDHSKEKFIIMNTNYFISFGNQDAEQMLLGLRKLGQN